MLTHNPFCEFLKELTKPTKAAEWLASDAVNEQCDKWREERENEGEHK